MVEEKKGGVFYPPGKIGLRTWGVFFHQARAFSSNFSGNKGTQSKRFDFS